MLIVLVVFDLGLVVLNLRENAIKNIKKCFLLGFRIRRRVMVIYLLCIDLFIEFLSDCMFKE